MADLLKVLLKPGVRIVVPFDINNYEIDLKISKQDKIRYVMARGVLRQRQIKSVIAACRKKFSARDLTHHDWLRIFDYLDVNELIKLERVNKMFFAACNDTIKAREVIGNDRKDQLWADHWPTAVVGKPFFLPKTPVETLLFRFGPNLKRVNLGFLFENYGSLLNNEKLAGDADLFKRMANYFPNIEVIDSYFNDVTVPYLLQYVEALPHACKLKFVSLMYNFNIDRFSDLGRFEKFTDRIYRVSIQCPQLKRMAFAAAPALGDSLMVLSNLDLYQQYMMSLISDFNVFYKLHVQTLEYLSVGVEGVKGMVFYLNSTWRQIGKKQNSTMTTLILQDQEVDASQFALFIEFAPNLRKLELNMSAWQCFESISKLTNLETLIFAPTVDNMSRVEKTKYFIDFINKRGHNLKKLVIAANVIFVSIDYPLVFIANKCKQLRHLTLTGMFYEDSHKLAPLDTMDHLRTITVDRALPRRITDILGACPKLQSMDVQYLEGTEYYAETAKFLNDTLTDIKLTYPRLKRLVLVKRADLDE